MKVKSNVYDKIVEILCLLCMFGVVVYLFINWQRIPSEIPGHFNASGQVDRITDKNSLFALLIVTWIMYIGLSAISHFPNIWNTGVTITAKNKEKVYRIIKYMLVTEKLVVVCIFSYLTLHSTTGNALPSFFLPLFLTLVFGTMVVTGICLIKIR